LENQQQRILIVTASLRFGGVERMVQNIANYYQTRGWKVLIATLLDPEGKVSVSLNPGIETTFFKNEGQGLSGFKNGPLRQMDFLYQTNHARF